MKTYAFLLILQLSSPELLQIPLKTPTLYTVTARFTADLAIDGNPFTSAKTVTNKNVANFSVSFSGEIAVKMIRIFAIYYTADHEDGAIKSGGSGKCFRTKSKFNDCCKNLHQAPVYLSTKERSSVLCGTIVNTFSLEREGQTYEIDCGLKVCKT